jgi:galactose mutarotase-like enzyme
MTDRHRISGGISATVKADGAELCSLQDAAGRELLWGAGPQWPSHSPVLFPVVGQLTGDRLLHDGRSYPMGRHGFARHRRFAWTEQGAAGCRMVLQDDAESRAVFPFAFRLALSYRVEGGTLHVDYELANPGPDVLPASLGTHPAFRWPLLGGAQTDCQIEFAEAEDAPIRRLDAGLLRPAAQPSPVQGRTLALDSALFADDAIIMLHPRSRSLRYLGPGGGIEFAWHGFPQLGLWQKPGAELLCIEPWHGYASPAGWDGEFGDKPGLMLIAPGEARTMGWSVRPLSD